MENKKIEKIIRNSIEIGVYNTLNQLGILKETVTEAQAKKQYGERLIDEWRRKRWIVGYPSGNKERGKIYFKRTELETARRMHDINNIILVNIFNAN